MSDDSSPHIEYASVAELLTEYKNYMKDPVNVEIGANYLLNSLIDETILGVVFEVHHAYKTGTTDDVEGTSDEQNQMGLSDISDINVFGPVNSKKSFDCKCPNCDRLVAAQRFAPHLEKCMGMGRNSSRIASRRIANSRDNYYGNFFSDDDDEDWLSEKRRKKHPTLRANGTRKNGMKKTS